jgi:hypothetical protein
LGPHAAIWSRTPNGSLGDPFFDCLILVAAAC